MDGQAPAATPPTLGDVYNAAGKQYGVSPSLLYAIGTVESGNSLKPVTSTAGAQGIQQVEPTSAPGAGNLQDPTTNIYNSAKILSQFVKQYGDGAKALMAYNAGTNESKWNPAYVAKVAAAQSDFVKKFPKGAQTVAAAAPQADTDTGDEYPALPDISAPAGQAQAAAPTAPPAAAAASSDTGDEYPALPDISPLAELTKGALRELVETLSKILQLGKPQQWQI